MDANPPWIRVRPGVFVHTCSPACQQQCPSHLPCHAQHQCHPAVSGYNGPLVTSPVVELQPGISVASAPRAVNESMAVNISEHEDLPPPYEKANSS